MLLPDDIAGLAPMLLKSVWAEHAPSVSGTLARKTVAVSTSRLLKDCPELLATDAFGALMQVTTSSSEPSPSFTSRERQPYRICSDRTSLTAQAAVSMVLADAGVAANESADGAAEEAEDGIEAEGGYSAAYVALNFASNAEVDLYADAQAAAALAAALSAVSAANPGRRALRVTLWRGLHT